MHESVCTTNWVNELPWQGRMQLWLVEGRSLNITLIEKTWHWSIFRIKYLQNHKIFGFESFKLDFDMFNYFHNVENVEINQKYIPP